MLQLNYSKSPSNHQEPAVSLHDAMLSPQNLSNLQLHQFAVVYTCNFFIHFHFNLHLCILDKLKGKVTKTAHEPKVPIVWVTTHGSVKTQKRPTEFLALVLVLTYFYL